MPVEIEILGWAGLLAVAQLLALSATANATMSSRYLAGPRDKPAEMPVVVGRLERAFRNHLEGLAMFTAAVVVTELGKASGPTSILCAYVYIFARVLYVPAYVSGIRYVRSAIWAVGFFATAIMLTSALMQGWAE